MANVTLYELLGISKERADDVAKRVRASYSESRSPEQWIERLKEEFGIDRDNAEIFACGWFAGKYAGVSEVFNVVAREIDEMKKDQAENVEKRGRYPPQDGYA
jgi:hypothetical protein